MDMGPKQGWRPPNALLGAGSVLAKLDGGQRVLEQLAAPMTLAAQELLARLVNAALKLSPDH